MGVAPADAFFEGVADVFALALLAPSFVDAVFASVEEGEAATAAFVEDEDAVPWGEAEADGAGETAGDA